MRLVIYLGIEALLSFALMLTACVVFAQIEEEQFIYDSRGRRDPFIPLLDKETLSGLRTSFIPPEEEVKLPLAVKIKGILRSGEEYFAIINDQVMKKGQNLGRVKVKEIGKNKVILEYGQKDFTIFFKKEKKE